MDEFSTPPELKLGIDQLTRAGFIQSGSKRFIETVVAYSALLFERSVRLADFHKVPELRREITHEHVKAAAHSIADSFGKPPSPKWALPVQVGEYVATAIAGIGGGNLKESYGVAMLVCGTAAAVLLLMLRVTKGRGE